MTRLLTAVGGCVGLVIGLAIAPGISDTGRWIIGIGAVVVLAGAWAIGRQQR